MAFYRVTAASIWRLHIRRRGAGIAERALTVYRSSAGAERKHVARCFCFTSKAQRQNSILARFLPSSTKLLPALLASFLLWRGAATPVPTNDLLLLIARLAVNGVTALCWTDGVPIDAVSCGLLVPRPSRGDENTSTG